MRRNMPRMETIQKRRWSLLIPSVIAAIILLYLHFLEKKLQQIGEESGEEVSPEFLVVVSNQDSMIDREDVQQLQQQQRSLEPSAGQKIQTDDVNKKAIRWLERNENDRSHHKGSINYPLKFNPPPGYWEHPHQEFNANYSTQLDIQNRSRLRQLQRLNDKLRHPILPKRVITVVGPESSGSTFLATTLAVAAGVNLEEKSRGRNHRFRALNRRARTVDGELEIQHLSLPWGMFCGINSSDEIGVNVVDALVPGECFRYELAPSLRPFLVEDIGFQESATPLDVARNGPLTEIEARALQRCRDEAFISEQSNLSCGAKCGTGKFDGYALYPSRFSVNITSHVEWYLQRGVDVTVILSTRDRSISKRGKERLHCKIQSVARREDEVALELMNEGLTKYGTFGSIGRDRVFVSSYEALMSMKDEYLFGLYKVLRINSTYVPSFEDGNEKYVTDANEANVDENSVTSKHDIFAPQLPTSDLNSNHSLLPKKLITVVGLEGSGSTFLSTTLGKVLLSTDGETRLQHISLPQGCDSQVNASIVDALVPEECFCYEHKLKDLDTLNTKQCQDEVNISEDNIKESIKWTCGAKCAEGQFSGLALYPDRFYINLTSHINWYLTRSVDVKVVLFLRDKSISNKEKLRNPHCHVSPEVANVEDDNAMEIMREAYQKYRDERVMIVSYEGLMQYKESYLFEIYRSLGIKSTYLPDFIDENRMFVAKDLQHQMQGPSRHKKGHANEIK
eukprot:scaffold3929_cov141-Skeletonema_menzelii.AAC.7